MHRLGRLLLLGLLAFWAEFSPASGGGVPAVVCKLPKDSGPCFAHMPRYYYDTTSRTCEIFIYGGCRGNGNRFATKTECMMVCGNQRTG